MDHLVCHATYRRVVFDNTHADKAGVMELAEYMLETLWQEGEFILYRGQHQRHTDTSPPSILAVTPILERPALGSLRRMEHAYALRAELDPAWAVRPLALTRHNGREILVLTDPGGEPLARQLGRPMALPQFLRLAIGLTAALRHLHAQGLIHKDIKPAHVLVNWATSQVWLMGFGIASQLPRERQSPEPPECIAGTLAYMAPEQTGRMNRSIDARSDLYALGVTLYHLLTGSLPFTAADPMEWVHCHIARQPVPPRERLEHVPAPVSAIIMKLLAKTAEERYQTAGGVERELRRCLAEWEARGDIDDFPLGQQDTPDRLLIPEKLYGRTREVATLLSAFDRIVTSGAPELVLVSGYAGIGKSAVVNELHKVLVPPRGLFAAGKFDQYKRDIPYATLAQAFQRLVRPLLGTSDTALSGWRDALREALGPNGRLMVDVVPELQRIIGEPPPVPELPPQDAQRRFQLVFRRFIGVFARPDHPLALFLDDLQWLDAATLDLLEDLLTRSELQHLMLIGAYRDNEVTAAHPLLQKLDTIKAAGGKVTEITLAPLAEAHLGQLLADALRCESERAAPLAHLLHEKTGGNPFFAIQFMTSLAEEGLLTFDHDAARWSWELDRIHATGYTENVVDLMVGKLTRLPASTQQVLQQLACLGNIAEIPTLALVLGTSEERVHAALWPAVRQEFVEHLVGAYRFVHDRVQEAAYALLPEERRGQAHLRIGRLLVAHTPPEKREAVIFDIVNQLNRGAALITSQEEREQVAALNLMAGKRAKTATAYAAALAYCAAGRAMLAEDCWERQYRLTFDLECHQAECEFLTGERAAAAARLLALWGHAATLVDRAAVTRLRVVLYTTLGRFDLAIEVGREYLRHVGLAWPRHPTEADVRQECERMWQLLDRRAIEALLDLPLMTSPEWRATMDVFMDLVPTAVATDRNLVDLVLVRMVNLSLEHGNCDASCYAYTCLSRVLGVRFGEYQTARRFGQLACDLVEQRGLDRFKARVYTNFGGLVIPWTQHLPTSHPLMRRAIDASNVSGDMTFVVYGSYMLTTHLLISGEPLDDVQREAENGFAFARQIGSRPLAERFTGQLMLIRTLRGLEPDVVSLDDAEHGDDWFETHLDENPHLAYVACRYWICKLQACFFLQDYAAGIRAATNAERLLWLIQALVEVAEYHFYGALTRAAVCDAASSAVRRQHLEALVAHHKQLTVWAEHCPENFANRAALVGAEVARLEGRELDAERLYEEAIRLAREHGFVQNEGLANELAARFYVARGFETIAHAYLRNARYCYLRWRADGKVRQLDDRYPHLRHDRPVAGPTHTIEEPVEHLDLATVIKVSQAVSSEIVLDKLLDTLMRTALAHAGAARGLLLLPHGAGQRIEAEATISGDTVVVRLRGAAVTATALPESIVRYVVRTHESVMLGDASVPNLFAVDPYLRQQHARSLLCVPLIHQAKLIGVLYLENHLTPHVFTPTRIAVLTLLAVQAAISLENARLYTDLQHADAELRQLVDVVPQLIVVLGPDGRTLHANQVALDYTGRTLQDLQAEDFVGAVVPPEDLEHVRGAYWRGLARGVPFDLEARLRGKDAQYRWFLLRHNPLRHGQGHISRWYATATEIEGRKQAEERVRSENLALREDLVKASMFEEIIGTSPALHAVLADVAKVAQTDATVLITGETGTGKELIARAIHKRSRRAAQAFVSVNCAVIPPSLIASELFGHEKGAFTGALQRRLGRFELAEGGTIFLDEIGELPAETQVALLRVLQERAFERVGGTRMMHADVRVIAATNRDLPAAMATGTFRSDLFYRLNVFPIEIPPLRDRRGDIPLLVEYFVDRYASQVGKKIQRISQQTLDLLTLYPWPGNIRELQNVIERSVIVCETETFSVDARWLLRESVPTLPHSQPRFALPVAQQKDLIEAALAETRGRISGPAGAAARLGIPPSTLDSKIKALKINKHRFKTP